MVIQWDITYLKSEVTRSSFLFLWEDNKDIMITDHNGKLNANGENLLKNRASVSIKANQVNVTIQKLEYNDYFNFSCQAFGYTLDSKSDMKKLPMEVKNIQGNNYFMTIKLIILVIILL